MKKLIVLGLCLLMVQLCFSQQDTTVYPKIGYPKEVIKDTCVLFTPEQAKYAAEDAINADNFKQQLDSAKHIINEHQKFINSKNDELRHEKFIGEQKDLIIQGFKDKELLYIDDIKDRNRKLKLHKVEQKIIYPVLVALIITTVAGFLTK